MSFDQAPAFKNHATTHSKPQAPKRAKTGGDSGGAGVGGSSAAGNERRTTPGAALDDDSDDPQDPMTADTISPVAMLLGLKITSDRTEASTNLLFSSQTGDAAFFESTAKRGVTIIYSV